MERILVRLAGARVGVLFVFHAVVFVACYTLATFVRFDFAIPIHYHASLASALPLVVGVQLLIGFLFSFYRGWWRYVGVADVVRLVIGLSTATVTLAALWYADNAFGRKIGIGSSSRGVLLIDFSFVLLALFGARLFVRVSRDKLRPASPATEARRVIIIGAGDAGETLAREIQHRPQLGMTAVTFVDDQRAKWGSLIRGIGVTGPISDIRTIADAVGADEALIAIPSASGKRMREIIGHLSAAGLQFKTIPGLDQVVSGKVELTQLRPVAVEDLLRRKRIELPGDRVRQMFRSRRVLVTGAGGTIGSELASQIVAFEPESIVLLDRSEYALYEVRRRLAAEGAGNGVRLVSALLDIQQKSAMRDLFETIRPEIVLHAAAHKHVPLGEENPAEYVRNNALATHSLAELCDAAGVERFVLVSTDKAINPTSVMGASKRAAEILLLDVVRRSATLHATTVRFGNVIGSSGSVIPLFLEQIAAGGPITVTHPEVTRYFLRTSEAVSLVLQAATLGHREEVFMLDMGEPVKIAELARDLVRLCGHADDDIPVEFTGLRPGEKLREEVRLDGESMQRTIHPQIVITAAPQPDHSLVAAWLSDLTAACDEGRDVVPLLRTFIPEYTPAASISTDRVPSEKGEPSEPVQGAQIAAATT